MSITGGVQGTLGGMALVYMYTATDQGLCRVVLVVIIKPHKSFFIVIFIVFLH